MRKLDPQVIREINLKHVFSKVLHGENKSRSLIAKETGLTKTTVSSLVDDMINRGYLRDKEKSDQKKPGRKPSFLSINSNTMVNLSIKWTKKSLYFALVSLDSKIIFSKSISDYSDEVINLIIKEYEQSIIPFIEEHNNKIVATIISIPAIIDDSDKSIFSTVVDIDDSESFIKKLSEELNNIPILFINDTSSLGYYELNKHELFDNNFAYIVLDKGVGAAIFEKGKMRRGAGASSTQFGHVSVKRDGLKCSCGGTGCLEVMIGELNLYTRAKGYLSSNEINVNFNYKDLRKLFDERNENATIFFKTLADDMAFALSNIVTLYNPEFILIGGSGKILGIEFINEIKNKLSVYGFQRFAEKLNISYSSLEEGQELIGASQYFVDKYLKISESYNNKIFFG